MYFSLLLDCNYKTVHFEYFHLYFYFGFLVILLCILVLLAYSFAPAVPDQEKLASYECGFEPFGDARSNFDIHFYLVGILFLIFDLEVVFLYPWIFSILEKNENMLVNLHVLYIFFILLGVGFIFEWKKKALNWSPSI
jgi:NADH-quinone oxidoreductase subunit A